MKKIVFVAHEFGLFKGHGGIASYLDILVRQILFRNEDIQIYIFTYIWDKNSEILKNNRLKVREISGDDLHEQGKFILKQLCKIRPDYVECADYLGLCLESLMYKSEDDFNELSETTFITLHHTASRECYEWNDKLSVEMSNAFIYNCFMREWSQMKLSDLNVTPSTFLTKYVTKNYKLNDVITINTPHMMSINRKSDTLKIVREQYDISEFENKFIINCISRIEGRKNQKLLVEQFILFLKNTNADALLLIIGNSSLNSINGEDFRLEIFFSIPDEYRNRILFFDFMNTKEKTNILAISDVTVLASTYENFPIAMMESICNEVPVMCSKYCGFSDCLGKTKYIMNFDPFKDNDLCEKITTFYNLSKENRNEITKEQSDTVVEVCSPEVTVDRRLSIYKAANEKRKDKDIKIKPIVIDEFNFLDIIDEKMIFREYDSIIVHFYFDKSNAIWLERLFSRIHENFVSGDIVVYGRDTVMQTFSDAIIRWAPFFIKGVKFDEECIGMRLVDLISKYTNTNKKVFSLLDDDKHMIDGFREPPSYIQSNKREYFRKRLLDDSFLNEYNIDLEEKI